MVSVAAAVLLLLVAAAVDLWVYNLQGLRGGGGGGEVVQYCSRRRAAIVAIISFLPFTHQRSSMYRRPYQSKVRIRSIDAIGDIVG
jgi:hypothetical protein